MRINWGDGAESWHYGWADQPITLAHEYPWSYNDQEHTLRVTDWNSGQDSVVMVFQLAKFSKGRLPYDASAKLPGRGVVRGRV